MSEDDPRQALASRLRDARKLSGLSQGQVAVSLGLHRPAVTEMEAGNRRVSAEELGRLAELYDVSVGYLLGQTPGSADLEDPRLKMAARELRNLPPESLEKLLQALAALRSSDAGGGKT